MFVVSLLKRSCYVSIFEEPFPKSDSLELLTGKFSLSFFFFKDFIYLCLVRGERREKEKERNISVWLPLVCLLLGTWPATQARALTGNQTSDPLVHRSAVNPLSHTSQGKLFC